MNLSKALKNEKEALKAILVVNGKFNKGEIMRQAWAAARRMAAHVAGSKACEFFAKALKNTWATAKA